MTTPAARVLMKLLRKSVKAGLLGFTLVALLLAGAGVGGSEPLTDTNKLEVMNRAAASSEPTIKEFDHGFDAFPCSSVCTHRQHALSVIATIVVRCC
jgi:hypothetical protein